MFVSQNIFGGAVLCPLACYARRQLPVLVMPLNGFVWLDFVDDLM